MLRVQAGFLFALTACSAGVPIALAPASERVPIPQLAAMTIRATGVPLDSITRFGPTLHLWASHPGDSGYYAPTIRRAIAYAFTHDTTAPPAVCIVWDETGQWIDGELVLRTIKLRTQPVGFNQFRFREIGMGSWPSDVCPPPSSVTITVSIVPRLASMPDA